MSGRSSCAVPSCSNSIYKNPNLLFFGLPRDTYVKEEWMEVMNLRHKDVSDQVRVCELHFKPKDFCSGRKQLKTHAVPALRLRRGKSYTQEESDDDDDFMQCNSDSDPEIIEIKKISEEMSQKVDVSKIKMEVKSEVDSTSTEAERIPRRPSRRAALVAAEKISSTVRKLGIDEPLLPKKDLRLKEQKELPVAMPAAVPAAIRVPIPDIGLMMECNEEILSTVQAESLLKSQLEYNMVMKKLRTMKASNARIVCTLAEETDSNTDHGSGDQNLSTDTREATCNEITEIPSVSHPNVQPPVPSLAINCDSSSPVVPVKLSAAFGNSTNDNQIANKPPSETSASQLSDHTSSELSTAPTMSAASTLPSKRTFVFLKKTSNSSQPVSYKLMLNSNSGHPVEKSVCALPLSASTTISQGNTHLPQKISDIKKGLKLPISYIKSASSCIDGTSNANTMESSSSNKGLVVGRLPDGLTIVQNLPTSRTDQLVETVDKSGSEITGALCPEESSSQTSVLDMNVKLIKERDTPLVPKTSSPIPFVKPKSECTDEAYNSSTTESSSSNKGFLVGRLPDGLTILQNLPTPEKEITVKKRVDQKFGRENKVAVSSKDSNTQENLCDTNVKIIIQTDTPVLPEVSFTMPTMNYVKNNQANQQDPIAVHGVPQNNNNNAFVVVGRLPDGLTILQDFKTVEPAAAPEVTGAKSDENCEVLDSLETSLSQENHSDPIMEKAEDIKFAKVSKEKYIPLVFGGHTPITPSNLLAVKPSFPLNMKCNFGDNVRSQMQSRAENLRKKLELDGILSDPIQWLITMKLIPEKPLCRFCFLDNTVLQKDRSSIDGYSWHCLNPKCLRHGAVSRPKFFSLFTLPLSKILSLVFHWAVQSDVDTILKDTDVTIPTIRYVWRVIQEVCSKSINFKAKKLGGRGKLVEVSVIQMGRFFIVAAMDRATKHTRIKAIPINLGWKPIVFQRYLESWLIMQSVVISDMHELHDLESKGYIFRSANSTITNRKSADAHILTISYYLKEQLSHMFGKLMVNRLRVETLQYFLDELQWRERFGIITSMAFWNILTDIGRQSGRVAVSPDDISTLASTRVIYSDLVETNTNIGQSSAGNLNSKHSLFDVEEDISEKKMKTPTVSPDDISTLSMSRVNYSSSIAASSSIEDQSSKDKVNAKRSLSDADKHLPEKRLKSSRDSAISLEEYYYARKAPIESDAAKKAPIPYFRCNFCKRLFSNNIRMMSHIIGHVEESRSRNLDLSDLTRCKHCFRSFDTPFNMQSHIVAVHIHPNPLTCRICSLEFLSVETLVAHMESTHTQSEMPYHCRICEYRSSFHQEVLKHFQKAHSFTDDVLCPYCLKVYGIRFSNQKYCYHLFRHQFKSSVRKCSSCCLGFLNGNELQAHRSADHISMANSKGLLTYVAGKNRVLMMAPKAKTKSPSSKLEAKATILKSINSMSFSEFLKLTAPTASKEEYKYNAPRKDSFPNINIDGPSAVCVECKRVIQKDHFKKHVRCGTCKFSTFCSTAFVEHMIGAHSTVRARRQKINILRPIKLLQKSMSCCCGFSSRDGSILAAHLVQCGKTVAYAELLAIDEKCSISHFHPFMTSAGEGSFRKCFDSLSLPKTNKNGHISGYEQNISEFEQNSDSEDVQFIEPEILILENVPTSSGTKLESNTPVESKDTGYFTPYITSDSDEEQSSSQSFPNALEFCSVNNVHSIDSSCIKQENINFEDPLQVESKVRILDDEAFSPPENREPDFPLENHSAVFPPLIVLDSDEEASIKESFSKVLTFPTIDISSTSETDMMAQMEDEPPEEKPDMFQALGLMRRTALPTCESYSSSPARLDDHTYTIQDYSEWYKQDDSVYLNLEMKQEKCDSFENAPENDDDNCTSQDKPCSETQSVRLRIIHEDDSKTVRIHGEKHV